ncbi:MAG: heme exporter protein CcmD [Colwellia sp.]
MQFENISDFLAMGGYGFYVWLSFGISTILLLALIFSSISSHKQVIKNIAMRMQREDKLRQVRKQNKKSTLSASPDKLLNKSTHEITQ